MTEQYMNRKNTEEDVCDVCFYTKDKCTCNPYLPKFYIPIDIGLHEHIRILNEKGYTTSFCCESHNQQGVIYIYFSSLDLRKLDCGIPEGFKLYGSGHNLMYKYPKKTKDEQFEELKQKQLDALLTWAKELPERPNAQQLREERKTNYIGYYRTMKWIEDLEKSLV